MELADRVKEISKHLGLTHVGSNLSVLPILIEIYANKKPEDIVILDGAHAHLAHLVVKYKNVHRVFLIEDEKLNEEPILKYGIHCDRQAGCDSSGGSLGHGLGISIGFALADPKRAVYCVVTDGSMMEGSNWEALRLIHELAITNIKIYCNFNGFSAVTSVNVEKLEWQMRQFYPDIKVYHTKNGLGENKIADHYTIL